MLYVERSTTSPNLHFVIERTGNIFDNCSFLAAFVFISDVLSRRDDICPEKNEDGLVSLYGLRFWFVSGGGICKIRAEIFAVVEAVSGGFLLIMCVESCRVDPKCLRGMFSVFFSTNGKLSYETSFPF